MDTIHATNKNSRSAWLYNGFVCNDCGYDVLGVCNVKMPEPDDYWLYCCNIACKNHVGEGMGSAGPWPEWMVQWPRVIKEPSKPMDRQTINDAIKGVAIKDFIKYMSIENKRLYLIYQIEMVNEYKQLGIISEDNHAESIKALLALSKEVELAYCVAKAIKKDLDI